MSVTIKDVAKLAGTSTATVSKVMNNSYSISEPTAERVRNAMEQLGYQPNAVARNFAKRVTRTIIFLSDMGRNVGFSNPHMFEMLCGLESRLTEKGYSLLVRSMTAPQACEYVQKTMEAHAADGFVIHASVISPELDAIIYEREFPHIVIGYPDFPNHFCWIDIDNRLAGEMAAKHLLEMGYQTLSFIGGSENDRISAHRLDGVLTLMQRHDLILPEKYLQRGEPDCDSGYLMTRELLASEKRPDAVICANNYVAYGCFMALKEEGIAIPNEMGIVTFDDYPFSRILKPMLTVVSIDVFEAGVQAGRYILQKIRRNNLYVQTYITVPELIVRESSCRSV